MYKVLQQKLWAPPRVIAKILLIMRLTTIILITAIMQVSASSFAQRITLREKNAPLVRIFERISEQSGYDFMFSTTTLKGAKNVTINVSNAELKEVLQTIFKDQPLEYEIDAKAVVVSKKETSFLDRVIARFQTINVVGQVVDEQGVPLPGVTVRVKGSDQGTTTNNGGGFFIKSVEENATIVFSYIGFKTLEKKATDDLGVVKMEPADSKLDEVQVIAYGTTSRRLGTGNVSTVKATDIEKSPVANPLLAIQGRVPGVMIQQSSGVPGSGIKIVIQGENSFNSGSDPFYVIDGVPYTSQMLPGLTNELGESGTPRRSMMQNTNGNPLNFINPQDIESIDVLKVRGGGKHLVQGNGFSRSQDCLVTVNVSEG
ncbi:STN domain-containing protein [Pedobacter sp. GR22-6]|uniref:STN domain-containing protein n=1 Tax=Pedobacter sp. GR22-6 TaxID=3127957 RepID=UPI00307F0BA2